MSTTIWPPPVAKKKCGRCGDEKRIAEFPAAFDGEGYFAREGHAICRDCHIDWSRAARQDCREATAAEKTELQT